MKVTIIEGSVAEVLEVIDKIKNEQNDKPRRGPGRPRSEESSKNGGNGEANRDRKTMTATLVEIGQHETIWQGLSCRQNEVLFYLVQGSSTKDIARSLNITNGTVKNHVKAILRKTGMSTRLAAAAWAHQHIPSQLHA